jgi:hypothetical protein
MSGKRITNKERDALPAGRTCVQCGGALTRPDERDLCVLCVSDRQFGPQPQPSPAPVDACATCDKEIPASCRGCAYDTPARLQRTCGDCADWDHQDADCEPTHRTDTACDGFVEPAPASCGRCNGGGVVAVNGPCPECAVPAPASELEGDLADQLSDIQAECENLHADLDAAEGRQHSAEADRDRLAAENERLNDALVARALSEASSVEAETDQLRADLAEARAENERLRGEKEKYVDEAVRRGEDGAHLVLRVGHVESALALIRDERDKLSDGLRAESARADRLERGPAAARAELDTLRTALSTVEAQWRDGQATIAELRGQLETRPVADLRQEADERAQLLAGRDATIAKLRRQLEQADHATIADQRGAIDALVSENNAQAARVAQLEGALETECDVSADRTWVGQYHCGIHGVWFRDDGKDVCECPVGKFARTAPQSPAASGGEKETKP